MPKCNHLPPLIYNTDYPNKTEYYQAIYSEFKNNIVGKTFFNRIIRLQHPENEQTIKHIVSKEINHATGKRIPDKSRAERITWIKQLIDEYNACPHCGKYITWKKYHQSRTRLCVLCTEENYILIFEEHGNNDLYLVTAYIVTPQKYNDCMREYHRYVRYGLQ